ncbi:MAG: recombination mediator RecR [Candidatus Tyrphobacter sp.]
MPAAGSILGPLQALIDEFAKFPTIGPKTAARLAFFLLSRPRHEAQALAQAIVAVKDKIRFCSVCFALTENDPCDLCTDERRERTICVVGEAKDVYAIERTHSYKGRYHVLGGLISPIDGVGPNQLHVRELLERIASERPSEIILATNPNAEGETTALYLSRTIAPLGVPVTRLAYGLPIGGDLDYADEITLSKSLEGRTPLS